MTEPPSKLGIAWLDRLPGADPYLVWGDLTFFRDYRMPEQQQLRFHVTVEERKSKATAAAAAARLSLLRKVCTTSQGVVRNGVVDEVGLKELVASDNCSVELSVARQRLVPAGGLQGDGAPAAALKDAVIAVIDWGCPFAHRQFLRHDGSHWSTRVRYLWDQDPAHTTLTAPGAAGAKYDHWYPVPSFQYGRETSATELDKVLNKVAGGGYPDEDGAYAEGEYDSLDTRAAHGAGVLDLAAGRRNPASAQPDQADPASDADIIFVQLPRSTYVDSSGGSMSMYVLDALAYILEKAKDARHLVINLSFGSTAGPHDGSSLLERAMDALIAKARADRAGKGTVQLVLPAGNHFLQKVHGCVTLTGEQPRSELVWQVMPDDITDSFLELWWPADRPDDLAVTLESPSGKKLGPVKMRSMQVLRDPAGAAVAAAVSGLATSNGAGCMMLLALARTETMYPPCAEHGQWKVTLESGSARDLVVDAWIQRDDGIRRGSVGAQSRLFSSRQRTIDSPDTPQDPVKRCATGNSLANGVEPVVVGACVRSSIRLPTAVAADFRLSDYSAAAPAGRGGWPHYVAAADESDSLSGLLVAGTRSGIRVRMNGTSVAAPQIARLLLNDAVSGAPADAAKGQASKTIADTRGRLAKLAVWK